MSILISNVFGIFSPRILGIFPSKMIFPQQGNFLKLSCLGEWVALNTFYIGLGKWWILNDLSWWIVLGNTSQKKKNVFLWALPKLPPPPSPRACCTTFFGCQNNVLAGISEPSNNDYDNDGSDNCDYNFGTFDDFGVKNYQKVSHNMILMSRHKGQLHGEKRANKFGQGPPPLFGRSPKENVFFFWEVFP